jgi:FtsH ternary system domain X5
MSRAFRICIRESLRKVMRAEDRVSTQLELLPILPPEQLTELLTAELAARGFVQKGDTMQRSQKGVTVTVAPASATVTVQASARENIDLETEASGFATSRGGKAAERAREALRNQARQSLETRSEMSQQALQADVTAALEAELVGLGQELNQVVNRVTAEALKRKAAQLGAVKQVTDDPQSGSLTIVVEV